MINAQSYMEHMVYKHADFIRRVPAGTGTGTPVPTTWWSVRFRFRFRSVVHYSHNQHLFKAARL